MLELSPSDHEVESRFDGFETKMRRLVALVSAINEASSHLHPGSKDVDAVQALASMLNETAPAAMGDFLWLLHGYQSRIQQIRPLLKSAA